MILDKALSIVIPTRSLRDYNDRDLDNLLESYRLAEIAKDSLIDGKVSFDEYIQLLECHQVNIDGYLETVEGNLETFRLV
jgi:hypothetical protein